MRARPFILRGAAAALFLLAGSALADQRASLSRYGDLVRKGTAALESKDYHAARRAFLAALPLAPQRAAAAYHLAVADMALGDRQDALKRLSAIAAMGVEAPADFRATFAGLNPQRGFAAIAARFARNTASLCPCTTVFEGPARPFIAEGLAFDPRRRRMLIASVYDRRIVSVAAGRMRAFADTLPRGLSPFSLTPDPARGLVWVTAASLPQSHGATAAQRGQSALLAFRLGDGALARDIPAPEGANLGDAALATDGSVYATDSRRGGVFVLKPGAGALVRVSDALSSAQGIALHPGGKIALVADYALGLQRLDLSTGRTTAVAVPPDTTTIGLDGIVRLRDGSFLATQNGIAPVRVVRFHLTADWAGITRFSVVARAAPPIADPSLVATRDGDAYLVGVSQWASFGEDADVPVRPVPAFRVVRLTLR
jgi:sugar lactone lactonase YvrE